MPFRIHLKNVRLYLFVFISIYFHSNGIYSTPGQIENVQIVVVVYWYIDQEDLFKIDLLAQQVQTFCTLS
jgi:hypothetical protein